MSLQPNPRRLAVATATLLAFTPPLLAATYTVDRFDDIATGNAMQCSDATPEDCSLRGAMYLADHTSGADTILLPPGVYPLTIPGDDISFPEGGLDYVLDPSPLVVEATTPEPTVIQQTLAHRVFDLRPNTGVVTLRGLTLTGGDQSGVGGAILSLNEGLVLEDVVLTGNQATTSGGCVYRGSEGPSDAGISFVDVLFSGCTAGLAGGGLYLRGAPEPFQDSLQRVRFVDNEANSGGGAYLESPAAGVGGAPEPILVEDSVFSGNLARGQAETSTGLGGALWAYGAELVVRRSAFFDNRAGTPGTSVAAGGAIFLDYHEAEDVPTSAFLENVTLSRNATMGSQQRGAGIYVDESEAILQHVTVTESRTAGQHAIFAGGTNVRPADVQLRTSTLDGGCSSFGTATFSSFGGNVEQPWDGTFVSTCSLGGSDVTTRDLDLRPIAVYGGPHGVPTQQPFPASPTVEAVDSFLCLAEDARTAVRTPHPCDAGAHELSGAAPGPWLFADGFESGNAAAWSAAVF